ncbi:MAG: hypothetical protein ACRD3Q_01650 [Terriglobales bacterium]
MDEGTRAQILEVVTDLHHPQQRLATASTVLLELIGDVYRSRVGPPPYDVPIGSRCYDWDEARGIMNEGFLVHADRTDAAQKLVGHARENLATLIGEEPQFTVGDTFNGQELVEWSPYHGDARFQAGQIEVALPHVSLAAYNQVFVDLARANRELAQIVPSLDGGDRDLVVGQRYLLDSVPRLDRRRYVESRDDYLDYLCTLCGIVRGSFEKVPPVRPASIEIEPLSGQRRSALGTLLKRPRPNTRGPERRR